MSKVLIESDDTSRRRSATTRTELGTSSTTSRIAVSAVGFRELDEYIWALFGASKILLASGAHEASLVPLLVLSFHYFTH